MGTNLPIVRASSMPLAVSCPASISGEGVQVDSFDPTATDGVEVHRAIAMALRGEDYPPFDGSNAGDNEDMVALALAYAQQNGMMPGALTEVHLEHPPFSATLDVFMPYSRGEEADLTDWKTTHREDDHEAQIIAQCAAAFANYPKLPAITAHTVYLRNEGAIKKRYTRAWVEQWAEEFVHNTLKHPEIYRPGDWCARCKRKYGCEGLRAMRREIAATFLADGQGMLTRDNVAEMRFKVKLIKGVCDEFDKMVRDEVLNHGPIALGEGKELRALDINTDTIDILRAWATLTGTFADSDLAKFVEVRKTAMLKLIEAGAPRGQKSKAAEAFMEKLRAEGAVTTTTTQQVRELAVREV